MMIEFYFFYFFLLFSQYFLLSFSQRFLKIISTNFSIHITFGLVCHHTFSSFLSDLLVHSRTILVEVLVNPARQCRRCRSYLFITYNAQQLSNCHRHLSAIKSFDDAIRVIFDSETKIAKLKCNILQKSQKKLDHLGRHRVKRIEVSKIRRLHKYFFQRTQDVTAVALAWASLVRLRV